MSLRTLRRMVAISEEWPIIDEKIFAEWDEDLYSDFDTEFEEEVNKVITEASSAHDIACEELKHRLIKRHPKVFTDELNGNTMKMEPVSVKFKPDAKKPRWPTRPGSLQSTGARPLRNS